MKVLLMRTDYPKLNNQKFTTIRRRGHNLEIGSICHVKTPKKEFNAMVTNRFQVPLQMIPEQILLEDTGTTSEEDAFKVLEECWDEPVTLDKDVVLIYLEKVDKPVKQVKYKKTYIK